MHIFEAPPRRHLNRLYCQLPQYPAAMCDVAIKEGDIARAATM